MTATIIGGFLIAVGVIFLFLGGLGIFRLPDVYNRLQAGTKCTTLGAVCTIIGVGVAEPTWIFKALIIALFVLLTNPISAHALARASRKSGVELWPESVVDKCEELQRCQESDEGGKSPEAEGW